MNNQAVRRGKTGNEGSKKGGKKKDDPLFQEAVKKLMLCKGSKTNEVVTDAMKDLALLKKPFSKMMQKKNEIHPFDDAGSLEFLAAKNECSLFTFGSNSKKRPNNLVFGRTYDGHLLDMVELGVKNYKGLAEFRGKQMGLGSKPCLVFEGSGWEHNPDLQKLQNYFTDFFRGSTVSKINLKGLDHVLIFSECQGEIFLRNYSIHFKKSGTRIPKVELNLMGPSMDFTLRRTKFASSDLWKRACMKPKTTKAKKVKNISRDEFENKIGRIHLGKQDIEKMNVKRVKAIKRTSQAGTQKDEDGQPIKRVKTGTELDSYEERRGNF